MKIPKVISNIAIAEGTGFTAGLITSKSVNTWYSKLKKPSFNPPSGVFWPVWTTLYALMGISSYLIGKKSQKDQKLPLFVYSIQLALNFLWTVIFFGFRSPAFAFFELILLWCAIVLTIVLFWRLSVKAGLMLLPYILWVSFAAVLNFVIWRKNR